MVLVAAPDQTNPLQDASELADVSGSTARIAKAGGYLNFGERAQLEFDARGEPMALWLGGAKLLKEADMVAAVKERFGTSSSASRG